MSLRIPKMVFVPFEWDGAKWIVRNDLPRFKEDYEAGAYFQEHPEVSYRDGKPVPISWIERNESIFIDEYLRGVGTPEYALLKGKLS